MYLYIHTQRHLLYVCIFFFLRSSFYIFTFRNYKSQGQKYLLGSASAEHSHQTDFL